MIDESISHSLNEAIFTSADGLTDFKSTHFRQR